MLTLIRREIRDHIIYFIAAVIFSAIQVGLLTAAAYSFTRLESGVYFGLTTPVIMVLVLGFAGMGVSQMYTDKNRKISAFLSALPVTRDRIFTAKVITGVLAILTALAPVAIAAVVWAGREGGSKLAFGGLMADIFTTAFLMALACYCIGLLTGWTTSKLTPSLGGLGLTGLLVSVIIIKGFGLHINLLLVLIIAASLTRAWRKYMSTSL